MLCNMLQLDLFFCSISHHAVVQHLSQENMLNVIHCITCAGVNDNNQHCTVSHQIIVTTAGIDDNIIKFNKL